MRLFLQCPARTTWLAPAVLNMNADPSPPALREGVSKPTQAKEKTHGTRKRETHPRHQRAGVSGLARHPKRREILLEQGRSRLETQGCARLYPPAGNLPDQWPHRPAPAAGRRTPNRQRSGALMNAPVTKEFHVDPARIASGSWCHTRDRQIGEGDISASYSADKIALEGAVRSPFTWKNTLWVCVSLHSIRNHRGSEAYRLVPEKFFDGTPISYHENVILGDQARQRLEGFYHGMRVKRGNQNFVLAGPPAIFLPLGSDQLPSQSDLFDVL
ncbi:hypothetical protein LA6_003696 [Marinibacterium anthonyi]|nr:hypothetical protein LA6_003696 [Marinibacterium anthonyi]